MWYTYIEQISFLKISYPAYLYTDNPTLGYK